MNQERKVEEVNQSQFSKIFDFAKKNIAIVSTILLPVAFLVIVIVGMLIPYIPNLWAKPQSIFLYAFEDTIETDYETEYTLKVVDGKLVRVVNPKYKQPKPQLKQPLLPVEVPIEVLFYKHDTKVNKSTPISFEEATTYTLDDSKTSPDGYSIEIKTVSAARYRVFFNTFYRDYDKCVLVGYGATIEQNVLLGENYDKKYDRYRYSNWRDKFIFLGWKL